MVELYIWMEQDIWILYKFMLQGVCTEAGMYALRERRVHVTQEDFEMAVAKVLLVVDIETKGILSI